MTPPPGPRTALSSAIKEGGFGSTYDFTLGFQRGWDAATEQGVHEAEARAGLDVERLDWQAVRSAVSNAYYEAREAGETMEAAADHATAAIRDLVAAAYGGRDGLREALDNLLRHHNAGMAHATRLPSMADCEFARQARAALRQQGEGQR